MPKIVAISFRALITLAVFLLAAQLSKTPMSPATVLAGSGITIDMPQSNVVPRMDGVCDPSEYADATTIFRTVGAYQTFPVYIKHTATDAYFCFGDSTTGLPLPDNLYPDGQPHVVVYIDPLHDGDIYGSNADDFRVYMHYYNYGASAATWGDGQLPFNGSDPGGWQAVKYQTPEPSPFWSVEFKISREQMGGWKHPIGLALFYHWWRWQGDDYSWPQNGIWANARKYGNSNLNTGTVNIGNTGAVNTIDGLCGNEYTDATANTFSISGQVVTAYYEHSGTDLYVCLQNLPVPDLALQNQPNAVVYLTRFGRGGGSPTPYDIAFSITYDGTIQVGSGDGANFTDPVAGSYQIARSDHDGVWDAEYRINSALIGNWWSRAIGLSVVGQNITVQDDFFSWPTGASAFVPNSWGAGTLIGLSDPPHIYLPIIIR